MHIKLTKYTIFLGKGVPPCNPPKSYHEFRQKRDWNYAYMVPLITFFLG